MTHEQLLIGLSGVVILGVLAQWLASQMLEAYPLSINSELVLERIEGTGISRLLAMKPNGEVNSLAALHFSRLFGRARVYQLSPEGKSEPAEGGHTEERHAEGRHAEKVSQELRGRLLIWPQMSYPALAARVAMGARFTMTRFAPHFTYDDFGARHGEPGDGFLPLFLGDGGRRVGGHDRGRTTGAQAGPGAGQSRQRGRRRIGRRAFRG